MERIILHVGMHKTGSTSIQRTLDGYRDDTFEYAKLPPPIEEEKANSSNHSLLVSTSFSKNYKNLHELKGRGIQDSEIEQIRQKCRSTLSDCLEQTEARVLIISAESIIDLDFQSTQELGDFLKQYTQDVQVFAYVRDPFDFVKSATQEAFKWWSEVRQPHPICYRQYFESLEDVFGSKNVNYRIFRRNNLVEENVVTDFCSWIGLPNSIKSKTDANTSMSTDAARCLYTLLASQIPSSGNALLYASRQSFIKTLIRILPGKFNIPDQLVANNIDILDLAWIEKRLERRLNIPPPSDQPIEIFSFEQWMKRVSVGMIKKVSHELASFGANVSEGATFADLIDQLYLECIRSVSDGKVDCRTFSASRYLEKYPDVRRAGLNPFGHYAQWGFHEGRSGSE
jgi:hypothetical protein